MQKCVVQYNGSFSFLFRLLCYSLLVICCEPIPNNLPFTGYYSHYYRVRNGHFKFQHSTRPLLPFPIRANQTVTSNSTSISRIPTGIANTTYGRPIVRTHFDAPFDRTLTPWEKRFFVKYPPQYIVNPLIRYYLLARQGLEMAEAKIGGRRALTPDITPFLDMLARSVASGVSKSWLSVFGTGMEIP